MGNMKIYAIIAIGIIGLSSITLFAATQDKTTASASLRSLTGRSELTTSNGGKIVSISGQSGKTALEILRSKAEIKTEQSSFGAFVTSINNVEANGIEHMWAFYVNDALADDSAQNYQTKAGDRIEWRMESTR